MVKNEQSVLITYLSTDEGQVQVSEQLQNIMKSSGYRVKRMSVKDSRIQDIAGSDILILGYADPGRTNAGYKEIGRALQGINLSGRTAAFYTVDNESDCEFMKQMFISSNITLSDVSSGISTGEGKTNLTQWCLDVTRAS